MRTESFPTALPAALIERVARQVVLVLQPESRCCMNRSYLAVVAAIVASSYLIADEKKPERLEPIAAASLNQRDVIGKIGVPLGHGATIEATVVSGSSLNRKGYDDLFLLQVDVVNGRKIDPALMMEFQVDHGANTTLVSTVDELRNRSSQKDSVLTQDEYANVVRSYVGSRVKLFAYESGEYRGLPSEFVFGRATRGFGFSTFLVVGRQLPLDDAKPLRKGQ